MLCTDHSSSTPHRDHNYSTPHRDHNYSALHRDHNCSAHFMAEVREWGYKRGRTSAHPLQTFHWLTASSFSICVSVPAFVLADLSDSPFRVTTQPTGYQSGGWFHSPSNNHSFTLYTGCHIIFFPYHIHFCQPVTISPFRGFYSSSCPSMTKCSLQFSLSKIAQTFQSVKCPKFPYQSPSTTFILINRPQ